MRFDALNCSEQAALSVCQCFFDSDRTYNPGSYKNELIHTRRWNDVVEVEIATFEWVSW
ncbi:hypothetical protein HMPREF1257_01895 [Corynebacterium sp. KPL1814]|nr:hypothetical protein HMPREF1281_01794 [Corynebacterium sp. KPL1855]ERS61656.1 hypothetical protein HMPREF1257_01895 [Corynebacterium sp. KPL1814]ERS79933.1 hypothetical protein HMPREF1285_01042 [Corynebacterium sp. KPL1859]